MHIRAITAFQTQKMIEIRVSREGVKAGYSFDIELSIILWLFGDIGRLDAAELNEVIDKEIMELDAIIDRAGAGDVGCYPDLMNSASVLLVAVMTDKGRRWEPDFAVAEVKLCANGVVGIGLPR